MLLKGSENGFFRIDLFIFCVIRLRRQLSLSSAGFQHNRKNIGSSHKHGGVERGGGSTNEPE